MSGRDAEPDVAPRDALSHADRLLLYHRVLLEQVASDAPLESVLDGLVRLIEEHAEDGLLASILVADRDGKHLRHGAAPSLPDEYNRGVDGIAVGPAAGSCGTAAFRREPVVTVDIETDPLWADYRELARPAGLRACWSTPLVSNNELLGTFAMYYRTRRVPEPADLEIAALFARTAALAIERHRAQQAREDVRAAEHDFAQRLSRLAGVSMQLSSAQSVEELTQVSLRQGLDVLGADGGVLAVLDADSQVLHLTFSESAAAVDPEKWARVPLDSPLPVAYVARERKRVLLPNRQAAAEFAPQMADVQQSTGRNSSAVVPLVSGTKTVGVLIVGWIDDHEFADDELSFIDGFAAQCAQSLDRILTDSARLKAAAMAQHLSEALQRSLLTQPPHSPRFSIAVRYLPAVRQAQVGGDWYDAFRTASGKTMLVVGDVNGHDNDAAASMGQIRNMLRGLAYDSVDAPAQLLHRLDQALRGLELDALATAVVVQVPPDDSRVCWSNAGHLPPLLLHDDGSTVVLESEPDLLLGLAADTLRRDHTLQVPEGSTLLLYTDGLVERRDEDLDDGIRRLRETLSEHRNLPLETMCDELVQTMLPEGGEDDVALLAIRPRAGKPDLKISAADVVTATQTLPIDNQPSSVRTARRFVDAACQDTGVAGDFRDTAVLLTSELVTNTVVHTEGRSMLSVSVNESGVRVEVADGSRSMPRIADHPSDATGGRGLVLVQMLATRWGYSERVDGKAVWFELGAGASWAS